MFIKSYQGALKKKTSHAVYSKLFINTFPHNLQNIQRIMNTMASILQENMCILFILGHHLFLRAHSFPWVSPSKKLFLEQIMSADKYTLYIFLRQIEVIFYITKYNQLVNKKWKSLDEYLKRVKKKWHEQIKKNKGSEGRKERQIKRYNIHVQLLICSYWGLDGKIFGFSSWHRDQGQWGLCIMTKPSQ